MNVLVVFICMIFYTQLPAAIYNRITFENIEKPAQNNNQSTSQPKRVKGAIIGIRPTYYRMYKLNPEIRNKIKNFNKPLLLHEWPNLKKGSTGEFLEDYEISLSRDNETPKENTSTDKIKGESISAIKNGIPISNSDYEVKKENTIFPIESSAEIENLNSEEQFLDSESEPEKNNHSVEQELENSPQTWRQYFRSKIPSKPSLPAMPNMPSLPSMPGMPTMPSIPKMSLPRPSWPKFLARRNPPQEEVSRELSYQEEPTEKPAKASWWPWSKKN